MADYLRPCIALAPWSAGNGGYYGPTSSYQAWGNPDFFNDARTPWARFWIRWDFLQPNGPFTDPATDTTVIYPGLTPQLYLAQQVWQIQAARAAGRNVILTLYAYPEWSNWQTRSSGGGNPNPGNRPRYNSPPWDVSASSPYAFIVWYLSVYFHPQAPVNPGVYMDFFEVVNEPNLQFWPQLNAQGQPIMHFWAAAMMSTARYVTRYTGNLPFILGPAISDTTINDPANRGIVDYDTFTRRTVSSLVANGVDDLYVAWSVHNYGDVRDQDNRARQVRLILESYGWTGWPYQDPSQVYVLSTEGGYLISGSSQYEAQRVRVRDNWNRMRGTAGIGMVTNYLTWSTSLFDSGLCVRFPDPPPDGSRPLSDYHRPVLGTWAGLPTSAPR